MVIETTWLRWIVALPALGVLFNVFVGRRATGREKSLIRIGERVFIGGGNELRKIRDLAVEFAKESHLERDSGSRFWRDLEHSFEGRLRGWVWQGAGVVQMVWMGVEMWERGLIECFWVGR